MKYKTLLLRNKTFCSKLVGVSAQDVGNMTGMLPRDWIALNIVHGSTRGTALQNTHAPRVTQENGMKQMPQRHPPAMLRVEEKSVTKGKHVSQQALMSIII